MNANFFNQIAQLSITGVLQLNITKGAENNLIVSVILQNEGCGDTAKNLIPPLNLRGTAEALDEGFFQQITTPIQTASGLMVDMEAFMKQLEEAKKQSAIEKEKTEKAKKEKEAKDKKFKDGMAKADESSRHNRVSRKSGRDTQAQIHLIRQVRNTEPFRSNGRTNSRATTNGRNYCRLSH
jgi:PRTRC genetic system protein E